MSDLASYSQSNRPPRTSGKKEAYLSRLTRELQNLITKTQNSFKTGPLYLHPLQVEEIASVLVEFAEDVHNDIGIWKSLEKYNWEFFGTPLPFLTKVGESSGTTSEFLKQRFKEIPQKSTVKTFLSQPSPQFVKRLVREYGEESIISAFRLQDNRTNYILDYLLRCYKGDKYRKIYPLIGLVQP